MKINYKTGKLPVNFVALGALLIVIGIWRIAVLDWIGILIFVIGLVLFFIKSGVIIDTESKRLKKYIGFFGIMKGEWENMDSLKHLRIIKSKETQTMNVLSISRTSTDYVYKLFMILHNSKIEIMSGKRDVIFQRANRISTSLNTSIEDNTE